MKTEGLLDSSRNYVTGLILSQINSVKALVSFVIETFLSTILPSSARSPNWSLPNTILD